MIAVRYQVFFIDPEQDNANQLSAVQPMFSTPTAVEALIKTVKFEKKTPYIVVGDRDKIEAFLVTVQRLDTTDWLGFAPEKRGVALMEAAQTAGLQIKKDTLREKGEEDTQVFGLEEVNAAAKMVPYPVDIPEANRYWWDYVWQKYADRVNVYPEGDDRREVTHRIIYENVVRKRGLIPWAPTTVGQIQALREKAREELIRGERRGVELIEKLYGQLDKEGWVKKQKAQKFFDVDYDGVNSAYEIGHVVEFLMKPDSNWNDVAKLILHSSHFRRVNKDELSCTIDRGTVLDVNDDGSTISCYIIHRLTPHQAATLTQQTEKDKIIKVLKKAGKLWYSLGSFPNLKALDKEK